MNILDVDFDFWVREDPRWGWDHYEGDAESTEILWGMREEDYPEALSRILSTEDVSPLLFWEHLQGRGMTFAPGAEARVASSHKTIGQYLADTLPDEEEHTVYHLDAHHDILYGPHALHCATYGEGKGKPRMSCGNWLLLLPYEKRIGEVHIVYPLWRKEEGFQETSDLNRSQCEQLLHGQTTLHWTYIDEVSFQDVQIDLVTVAHSPEWVPPRMDELFEGFLDACPIPRKVLGCIGR